MKRSDFVKAARELIGTSGRYLFDKYGVKTHWCMMLVYDLMHDVAKISSIPKTFSCSGFLATDFAKKRANHDFKTAEVGDIIFFEINGNRADGADHVGIVIDNSGGVISLLEGNTRGTTVEYYDSSTANVFTYSPDAPCFDCIIDMSEFFADDEPDQSDEPVQEEDQGDTFTVQIRTLRRGCKGEDVKALQRLLYGDGYWCGASADDGIFGECTERAVLEYQAVHKLEVDGIVGKQTFSEMWKK